MKFVLFRHAQKGYLPFEDPELSAKGHEEAARLTALVKNSTLPTPTTLLVSPKRRTSQTFYPTAKSFNLEMQVDPRLDQRLNDESASQFRHRVANFIDEFSRNSSSDSCVFACTHFDFIEEAMSLIPCDRDLNTFEFSHWSPVQFILFEINAENWTFLKKGDAR